MGFIVKRNMSNELKKGDILLKNGSLYTKNGDEKNGKNYITSCQSNFYLSNGFVEKIK